MAIAVFSCRALWFEAPRAFLPIAQLLLELQRNQPHHAPAMRALGLLCRLEQAHRNRSALVHAGGVGGDISPCALDWNTFRQGTDRPAGKAGLLDVDSGA